MNAYVYRLLPPRPSFATDMSEEEQAVMAEHAGYWSERLATGEAVAFGPVNGRDGSYGIAIIRAAGDEAARQLVDGDPAVRSPHGFATDIEPMLALVTANDLPG